MRSKDMIQLRAFKDKALNDIRMFVNKHASPESLQNLFENRNPWVGYWYKDTYPGEEWFFDTKLTFDKVPLKPKKECDINNAIVLHKSLPLSRIQATDERLWSYLSMVEYWDYTTKRWPLNIENIKNRSQRTRIRERYFVNSSVTDRSFLRNALSRLWWAVEMTKENNREDPYELTRIILGNTDIYVQVMERSFSRNEEVIKGILELFLELGEELYLKNRFYRQIVKQVNAMGGVIMLDLMTREDLKAEVKKYLLKMEYI